MKAKNFLHDSALSLCTLPGKYPSQGVTWYIERGKEIPGDLLPGRLVTKVNNIYPGLFNSLSSKDIEDVAPWWAKLVCSK